MLHVNFNAYNSYVTDSLYQWDINQKLNITGLELSTPPEIHFANANMERAIVRESVINNGTISVDIPNSILQAPLPIMAYIGVYEGETFKVIESIKIPVIPKPQPTDYKFVDDGGDIYSYNAILNELSRFETEYGYDVLKNDVEDLKTRVTPIELGGTGATTVEGAVEALGVHKWDTLGSLAYRGIASKNSSGETGTDPIALTIPCDNAILKDYNHFRVILKRGSHFAYTIEGKSYNAQATAIIYVKAASEQMFRMENSLTYETRSFEHTVAEDVWQELSLSAGVSVRPDGYGEVTTTYNEGYDSLKVVEVDVSLITGNDNNKISVEYDIVVELQGKR